MESISNDVDEEVFDEEGNVVPEFHRRVYSNVMVPELSKKAKKKKKRMLWMVFNERIMQIYELAGKSESEALKFLADYRRTHCIPEDLSKYPLPKIPDNGNNTAGRSSKTRFSPKQSTPSSITQPTPLNMLLNGPIPSFLTIPSNNLNQSLIQTASLLNVPPINPNNIQASSLLDISSIIPSNIQVPSLLSMTSNIPNQIPTMVPHPLDSIIQGSPIENLLKLTVYNLLKNDDTLSTNTGSCQSNNTNNVPQSVPAPQALQEPDQLSRHFHSNDSFGVRPENNGYGEPVELLIVPENHPEQFLKGEDCRIIEESILDLAIDQMAGRTRPQFLDVDYNFGYFIFKCANEQTAAWLSDNFEKIKKPPGIKKLILSTHLPRRSMIVGKFHNCVYDNDRILSIIDALNEGLNAKDWIVLRRIENGATTELVMSVSESVMETIEARNGKIFFKFGIEKLRLRTQREREEDLKYEQQKAKRLANETNSKSLSPPRIVRPIASPPWLN